MSAISLAKQAVSAFNREKPHSSITDWVEILTSSNYDDEAFDGIPELVESINLQPTGPAEASRAIRKKLKHGDVHRQYRALVLLKATVENGGTKFQTTFADEQLTDAIKHLGSDPATDIKVKRKLNTVLASWHNQFKDDPRMTLVANLYKPKAHVQAFIAPPLSPVDRESDYEKRKREEREEREEAKRRSKLLKQEEKQRKEEERLRKEEELRNRTKKGTTKRRTAFDFEKERPQVLNAIAETSQASNNLVNALTLVNTEHDSIKENSRVQECLDNAKQARKRIVRYIQLIENEEMIGTLLETNERVISALQMYDKLSNPDLSHQDVEDVQAGLSSVNISESEVNRLQERQRAAVERSINRNKGRDQGRDGHVSPISPDLHPDLQDLSFGGLGAEQGNLPPPIRPSAPGAAEDDSIRQGSLSDFSDYDSSDEDAHNNVGSTSTSKSQQPQPSYSTSYGTKPAARNYVNVSDDEDVDARRDPRKALLDAGDDPFADPFAD